ncbi:magnesium transporter [Fischerella thermalis]|uniref:magnesium transporter n=1 Tax=Fischerella thermalis TaxID=372787 RepID=UPI0015E0F03B|nr:magnesium transporter [Fischerella thermalis]MBF1988737.1 magnesium transporter [Fischerella thermalis M58_A2018_009]MBF2060313.1 magnesium transporter [Fischerella thermalis M66_A2018_004]MBF2069186.1 magnesium transporter [Fischerella thermalis M48_A2018_028]
MTDNPPSSSRQPSVSREELVELVRSQLEALLQQQNFQGAKALLVPVQPADIAQAIEGLPKAMQAIAFRLLSKQEAIEVYEYLDSSIQQSLIAELRQQEVLEIVDKMSPDDRARLFDELPAVVVERLLQQLSPAQREATALILGYKEGTAGRIMTTEYLSVKEDLTVSQAIERVRVLASATEIIYYLYVTDRERRLTGTLSFRDLVIAQPQQRLGEIMTRDVVFVYTDTDQEEVAQIIQRYDLVAVPVVDTEQRLVGIVTVDDVLDVLEQETTEDIYKLGAVEAGGDNYFQTNVLTAARKRVVWLFVLLIANTGTTAVISAQENILEQVVALAAFIPLLIDAGGNVGAQSSTVVIRGLNLREVGVKKALQVVTRETITGALLGAILGIAVIFWAYFLEGSLPIAITVGTSLLTITILAAVSGSGLPFLFGAIGLDPALMSAPFITSIVDVLGVFIYLMLARAILQL